MEKGNFLQEFVAGNVGGLIGSMEFEAFIYCSALCSVTSSQTYMLVNCVSCVGICVVYPLDTAKIRLQVYPTKYSSTFDVISTMAKQHGILSIYRGLASPAVGIGVTFAVSFSAYGHGCRAISDYKHQDIKDLSVLDMTLAGAYTGVVQTPVRQVVERIKSVMQIRERDGGKSPYSWSGSCASESNDHLQTDVILCTADSLWVL